MYICAVYPTAVVNVAGDKFTKGDQEGKGRGERLSNG